MFNKKGEKMKKIAIIAVILIVIGIAIAGVIAAAGHGESCEDNTCSCAAPFSLKQSANFVINPGFEILKQSP